MLDDNRPVLTLTSPRPGANASLERILVGAYDYDTGLKAESFSVTTDFAVNGMPPGENLARVFRPRAQGVWELKLAMAIKELPHGRVIVSIQDQQGNITRIEREFSVGPTMEAARR